MSEGERQGGEWLPPSDREYTPPEPARRPDDAPDAPGGADEQPGSGQQGWAPPQSGTTSGDPLAGDTASGGWQSPSGGGAWQRPPGAPAAWGAGAAQVQPSNGKATASLVLGIVGLFFCPVVCSVAAIVLGYQARNEIDRSGGRQTNRGFATAGIITGWVGVALGVLMLIGVVALGLFGSTSGGSTETFGDPAALLLGALSR